ncbi:hypothetical protein SSX86_003286 [Deinandra increscens subsp. villosa]|uniref:Jacalin-type lectin domain-containing protein n=1 Tax=Deinandra increscens subsp. villosa TaxID=3103831 RepID=A0AAP0H7Y5_9ASTR
MDDMFKMGPREMRGEIWDEKGRSELVEILITHQQDFINSIRFTYFINRQKTVHSQIYGEPNGLNLNMVTIDYPCEVLTSVSGEYNKADGRLVSIVFGTNCRTCGPFGRTSSTGSSSNNSGLYDEFKYDMVPGRFGGFHGSVDGGSVHAIGVYVKPFVPSEMFDDIYDDEFGV